MNKKLLLLGLLLVLIIMAGYSISQKYLNQSPATPVSPIPIATAAPVIQDDSQVIEKLDTMEETVACDKKKSPSPQPSITP